MSDTFAARIAADTAGITLYVSGELDIATVPQLRRALERLLQLAGGPARVDLSGVEFVDLLGLRCLLDAARAEASEGLVIVDPPPIFRRLLGVCAPMLPTARLAVVEASLR